MKGTIKAKSIITPQFDGNGAPISTQNAFSFDTPCKYQTANRNDVVNLGNGTFFQASYIITVKDMSFTAKQIQLINSNGSLVCEKNVKSLEVLKQIRRIKIIV